MSLKMKLLLTLVITGVLFSSVVIAETIRVPQDYITIQTAINYAADNDLILVSQGSYYEQIDFSGKAIEVRAESGPVHTAIDGQNIASVVTFQSGETSGAILRGFTIRFGLGSGGPSYTGGGITCLDSSPQIIGNVLWSNTALRGAGIYLNNSSSTISDCIIVDNNAGDDGGAVYISGTGSPSVVNCLATGNSAEHGGAIFVTSASPQVMNCTLDRNTGVSFGGGIYSMGNASATVTDCIISNSLTGHGVYDLDASSVSTVQYCDVWNNQAGEYGGSAVAGTGCSSADPNFVVGMTGEHYLSQIASGQGSDSPCLNAGSSTAINLGMDDRTTRTDQVFDTGQVDVGYHYEWMAQPTATPIPTETPVFTATPTPTNTPVPRILRVPSDYPYIQIAINDADPGDIVLVAAGTYYEQINFLGKDITVKSESGATQTIIDGSGYGCVVSFYTGETRGALLKEFTIQNGLGQTSRGGGITILNGSSPVIEGCVIRNSSAPKGGGVYIYGEGSEPLIQFCTIQFNVSSQGDGGGIYVTESAMPLILSSLIHTNTADYGGGIFASYSTPEIINNTILDNIGNNFGGGLYYLSAGGNLTNNIIVGQKAGEGIFVFETGDAPNADFNNVWDNAGGWYGGVAQEGPNDIHANPEFTTGPNGLYYLSQLSAGQDVQSPCVDTGSDLASNVGLDAYTTHTDHLHDYGIVDMGFHHGFTAMNTPTPVPASPTPTPTCYVDSRLTLNSNMFNAGDQFYLQLRLYNTCQPVYIDQFIILEINSQYWFWPSWSELPDLDYWPSLFMGMGIERRDILEFAWPAVGGGFSGAKFWCAAFNEGEINLDNLVGEILFVEFGWTGS